MQTNLEHKTTSSSSFSAFTYLLYTEIISLLRSPAALVPTLIFPMMFWTFFGIPNAKFEINGFSVGAYMLCSFAAYSAIQTVFFNIGIAIATERAQGFYKLIRVTPMRVWQVLSAKMLATLSLAALALVLLLIYGKFSINLDQPLNIWLEMLGRALIGMLPFAALGAFVGYVSKGAQTASPIINLIFFPLAFGSGLFIPLENLPKIMQSIALYLPSYHSGAFTRAAVGINREQSWEHLVWILGYTVLFVILAVWAYRRDEGTNYR
jgi:ABC-2 type transport system permease protein